MHKTNDTNYDLTRRDMVTKTKAPSGRQSTARLNQRVCHLFIETHPPSPDNLLSKKRSACVVTGHTRPNQGADPPCSETSAKKQQKYFQCSAPATLTGEGADMHPCSDDVCINWERNGAGGATEKRSSETGPCQRI